MNINDATMKIRVKEFHLEYKELGWQEKAKWDIVKAYDAFLQAKGFIDRRKGESRTKKIIKKILKILESLLYVAAAVAAKRL